MHIRLRHIEGEKEVTPEELEAVKDETKLRLAFDILEHPDPEIAEQAKIVREFVQHVTEYRAEQGLTLPSRILAFKKAHPGELEHVEENTAVFHEILEDFRILFGDVFNRATGLDGTVEEFEQRMMHYIDSVADDVHTLKHLVAEKSGKKLGVIEAEHLLTSEFTSMAFEPRNSVYPSPIEPRRVSAFVHATKGPIVGPNGELYGEEVKELLTVGYNVPSEKPELSDNSVISGTQLAS